VIAVAESTSLAQSLERLVARAAELANLERRAVIVSKTIAAPLPADPVAVFAQAGAGCEYRAYWEQPHEGTLFVGLGVARSICFESESRFSDAAAVLRGDRGLALEEKPDDAPGGLIQFAGFSFDSTRERDCVWAGFPAGLLVLPRLLLSANDGIASHTVNVLIEPDADVAGVVDDALRDLASLAEQENYSVAADQSARIRSRVEVPLADGWKARVAGAVSRLRQGDLEKVVLARAVQLEAIDDFRPEKVLRRLRSNGPAATVFAVAQRERCFVGATPERLVKLTDGVVSVDCLAGSIARGVDVEDDARLAAVLLASAKDRAEHEAVVKTVQDALAAVCEPIRRPSDTPKVVVSRNVQHLSTPLRGRLIGGHCVLDLVERLHPTPAVGGVPRLEAMTAIREGEGFDRGWYAGPVGWVDADGEGEFAVALRSGLLDRRNATLFAGAGIMADSDPDAEYVETGLKLKPMLMALGVE
jgi:isochorismate synthase